MDIVYEFERLNYKAKILESDAYNKYLLVIRKIPHGYYVLHHEIIIHGELEQIIDFTDLLMETIAQDDHTVDLVSYLNELNDYTVLTIDKYHTIYDGRIVTRVNFNEDWDVELRVRETNEFICDLTIPQEIVTKLIERGLTEVLREQIERNENNEN